MTRDPEATRLDGRCRVGVVPLGWPELSEGPRGLAAAAKRLRFEGIQWNGDGGAEGMAGQAFAETQVRPAEAYFAIRCTEAGPAASDLSAGIRVIREHQAHGTEVLVAAVDGSPERDVWAGRAGGAPQLSERGMENLAELLGALTTAAKQVGMRLAFHPHAGTYVETPTETQRLMRMEAAAEVGLCLDTGHWILGGGDPVEAIDRYRDRVTHIHLKDVDRRVAARLHGGDIADFSTAVREYVFPTLGTGVLALEATLRALDNLGYSGWLMVEQDSFIGSAGQAATASRAALDDALACL